MPTKKRETYKVQKPIMHGPGIKSFQQTIKDKFKKLGLNCPIDVDGYWGQQSRTFALELLKAMGMSRSVAHKSGFTPELRDKIVASERTSNEKRSFGSKANKTYRAQLKKQWAPKKAHAIVGKLLADSWDYHPGVHDGIDLLCPPNSPIFAPVKCKVVDVRASGWWGLGAPSNPSVKAKGDGIIQLQVLENVGPFKKGQHLGYGHAEGAKVKVGQVVNAGHVLGHAGLANAWHVHFMVNSGGTLKGIGNVNPRAIVNYTKRQG